jgi:hypothetical protein
MKEVSAMDVSYSAWKKTNPGSLSLAGSSFSFLFDRRYTNRLNRMSRIFFEAYVRATQELAASEDRFPSLSEIDAKMETGAVYAFKDRLMKSTEFFEEVKISGVSYLVPNASRFVDSSGTYEDLAFNFEEGKVYLPIRRKIKPEGEGPPQGLETPSAEEASEPMLSAEPEIDAKPLEEVSTPEMEPTSRDIPLPLTKAEPPKENDTIHPGSEYDRDSKDLQATQWERGRRLGMGLAVFALILVIAMVITSMNIIPNPFYQGPPVLIQYSAGLYNNSGEIALNLDVHNSEGFGHEMRILLPPNTDKSLSARGGAVTISRSGGTMIGLNSSTDANIRVGLSGNWSSLPVLLELPVPKGYDSALIVHGDSYVVDRKDDHILLRFNATYQRLDFEQSYQPS